jgi:ferredoxin
LKLYYTHKLASYQGEINYPACVGCGRCVEFCPVNINVIRVMENLMELKL